MSVHITAIGIFSTRWLRMIILTLSKQNNNGHLLLSIFMSILTYVSECVHKVKDKHFHLYSNLSEVPTIYIVYSIPSWMKWSANYLPLKHTGSIQSVEIWQIVTIIPRQIWWWRLPKNIKSTQYLHIILFSFPHT